MSEIQKDTKVNELNDISGALRKMRRDIRSINKNTKKNILSIEALKEEIINNNEQVSRSLAEALEWDKRVS